MADVGFGLTREAVMEMAYAIVEKTGQEHPFKSGHAGRGWYEGFTSRQAIRSYSHSHCRMPEQSVQTRTRLMTSLLNLVPFLVDISNPAWSDIM